MAEPTAKRARGESHNNSVSEGAAQAPSSSMAASAPGSSIVATLAAQLAQHQAPNPHMGLPGGIGGMSMGSVANLAAIAGSLDALLAPSGLAQVHSIHDLQKLTAMVNSVKQSNQMLNGSNSATDADAMGHASIRRASLLRQFLDSEGPGMVSFGLMISQPRFNGSSRRALKIPWWCPPIPLLFCAFSWGRGGWNRVPLCTRMDTASSQLKLPPQNYRLVLSRPSRTCRPDLPRRPCVVVENYLSFFWSSRAHARGAVR